MREGCGLQLISICDTLHDAFFQAQISAWEEARGQCQRLRFLHQTSDCTADDLKQGWSWFPRCSLKQTELTEAISVFVLWIWRYIFASDKHGISIQNALGSQSLAHFLTGQSQQQWVWQLKTLDRLCRWQKRRCLHGRLCHLQAAGNPSQWSTSLRFKFMAGSFHPLCFPSIYCIYLFIGSIGAESH